MWLFGGLVAAMWLASGMGVTGFAGSAAHIGAYFANLPRFVVPMSDYHAFYLFWWFSWSIMIGQFVSRFVGEMRTWQLAASLLVIPSLPLAAWFSVLYFYFRAGARVPPVLNATMVVTGILFVINSLDSLIRLYTDNLGLTARRLGTATYVAVHWLLLYGLVLAFQFTPLEIEWIGLVVIGLYAAVYALLVRRWRALPGTVPFVDS
jgi:choline-glycine betaine transporter